NSKTSKNASKSTVKSIIKIPTPITVYEPIRLSSQPHTPSQSGCKYKTTFDSKTNIFRLFFKVFLEGLTVRELERRMVIELLGYLD
ncbi:hypothetical protein, partial [Sinomicrobium sp.]